MKCKKCGEFTRVEELYYHPEKIERRRRCKNCNYINFSIEQWFDRAKALDERVNKSVKITPQMAKEIKALLAENKNKPPSERLSQAKIAERYGISQTQVSKINKGGSWGYL